MRSHESIAWHRTHGVHHARRTPHPQLCRDKEPASCSTRFGQTGDVGLSGLLGAERMRAYAELRLAPLRRSPSPGGEGGDDVRVLCAWLRHHAQGDPAARELGIHRRTLRKRLARIAGALEVDLESSTVRAELSLACQALGPDRG